MTSREYINLHRTPRGIREKRKPRAEKSVCMMCGIYLTTREVARLALAALVRRTLPPGVVLAFSISFLKNGIANHWGEFTQLFDRKVHFG